MSINIRQLSINKGGALPTKSFTDALVGGAAGSGVGSLGNNWQPIMSRSITAGSPAGTIIAGIGTIGTGGDAGPGALFSYSGVANPNTVYQMEYLPVPLLNSTVFNAKQQFSQVEFIQNVAGSLCGLCVYAGGAAQDATGTGQGTTYAYVLIFNATGPAVSVIRINWGTAQANIIATGILPNPAEQDIWRMSADSSSGTSTVITVTVNGVQKAQATDTSTSRIVTGYPGIYAASMNQTGNFGCRAFSGGIGL